MDKLQCQFRGPDTHTHTRTHACAHTQTHRLIKVFMTPEEKTIGNKMHLSISGVSFHILRFYSTDISTGIQQVSCLLQAGDE